MMYLPPRHWLQLSSITAKAAPLTQLAMPRFSRLPNSAQRLTAIFLVLNRRNIAGTRITGLTKKPGQLSFPSTQLSQLAYSCDQPDQLCHCRT